MPRRSARSPQSMVPRARDKEERAARAEAALRAAAAVVSEGDAAHGADMARAARRVTGVGTKLCALSRRRRLARRLAGGRRAARVDVLPDQAGDGDEGTAMLEILHDIAPGAELGFATAFTSDRQFADNIRALRFDAGCDVLVDDILYFNESPFQDGPIAQAVNDVTADGALYFSSAGNEGNMLDGTSGNYESDFRGSGRSVGKFAGEAHDFDPGPAVQIFEPISRDSSAGVHVTLFWAEPLGARRRRLRPLPVRRAPATCVNFSQDVQDGNDDPYEILGTPARRHRPAARGRALHRRAALLPAHRLRGRFATPPTGTPAWVDAGHARAGTPRPRDAFSIAAAPAADPLPFALEPGDPPNPRGPVPGRVHRAPRLPERFTSDGPRRMFFAPRRPAATRAEAGHHRRRRRDHVGRRTSSSSTGPRPPRRTRPRSPRSCSPATPARRSPTCARRSTPPRSTSPRRASTTAPATGSCAPTSVLAYTGATPQPLVRAQQPTVTPATGDGDAYLEAGGERHGAACRSTNVGRRHGDRHQRDRHARGDPQATVTPRSRSLRRPAARRDHRARLHARAGGGLPARQARPARGAGDVRRRAVADRRRRSRCRPASPATTARRFAYTGAAGRRSRTPARSARR